MFISILLFALLIFGIVTVLQRFLEGCQAIRLLECGRHVQATLTDAVVHRGKSTTYTLTFSYTAQDGSACSITKDFSEVKKEWRDVSKLTNYDSTKQSAPEETVIYDPHDLNRQVLLAHLDLNFKLNAEGLLTGDSLARGITCCIPRHWRYRHALLFVAGELDTEYICHAHVEKNAVID